ncbi:SHOCT domain-containing protein [Propioniciclava coleopterorum]|uniref:SHOCT domain-containing protein n=1 Tax=Propioniciclava coleopterorum TaxID=2714937 RepID=A0A6G7Y5N4_9ACTN|nr:SHOCT domain-containing protein [Propioniciclava coleopterorum]QIK72093.1 SHOCT domain-containing protein [Propioniciclava coleopterorum]
MFLIALLLFLFVLSQVGRLGPFEWAGRRRPVAAHYTPAFAGPPPASAPAPGQVPASVPAPWGPPAGWSVPQDPERILAHRLAEGDLTPDEYLERLSMLQSR